MILSDKSIRQRMGNVMRPHKLLVIEPLGENAVQPASVDVRLGRELMTFNSDKGWIDVREDNSEVFDVTDLKYREKYVLRPGQFVLGSTLESITVPHDVMARIEGKSSLARYGLMIHSTAGFVDPGWQGKLTLEISNVGSLPISLYDGMKIGHISFSLLTTLAERPYGTDSLRSKYQGQMGPAPSRYHQEYC